MATATPAVVTQKELHQSREYLALTSKQKEFVDTYLATSDARLATKTAYGANDQAYCAMLTVKNLRSPNVIAALDLAEGRSPHERFLLDLANDCKRAKGVARVEARKLYAKAMGYLPNGDATPQTDAEAEPFTANVGDIVLVDNQKFRVTAVNADGRPTDGEKL